jgi:hypothetical protein
MRFPFEKKIRIRDIYLPLPQAGWFTINRGMICDAGGYASFFLLLILQIKRSAFLFFTNTFSLYLPEHPITN